MPKLSLYKWHTHTIYCVQACCSLHLKKCRIDLGGTEKDDKGDERHQTWLWRERDCLAWYFEVWEGMNEKENMSKICIIINHMSCMNGKGFFILSQPRPKGHLQLFWGQRFKNIQKQMPFHRMHSYNLEFIAKNGGQKTALSRTRCSWRLDLIVATEHEINPGSGMS